MMFILKIPIVGLLWIVWWAVHETDEEVPVTSDDDGGLRRGPHPHRPRPHAPRRGPHGDPAPAAPPRTRPVVARSRETDPQQQD